MAELNVGELFCCAKDVVFMAETVRKHCFATCVCKFGSLVVAFFRFGNVGNDYVFAFFKSFCLASGFKGVNEVFVVGGVAVMQSDKTYNGFGCFAACKHAERKAYTQYNKQNDGQQFFHTYLHSVRVCSGSGA